MARMNNSNVNEFGRDPEKGEISFLGSFSKQAHATQFTLIMRLTLKTNISPMSMFPSRIRRSKKEFEVFN